MHPTRLVLRIALPFLLLAGGPHIAAAQTAIETASMNGIKHADEEGSMIGLCNSLAGAYNAATNALDIFGTINEAGQHGEDLVSKALGIKKNTVSTAGGTRIPDFRKGDKWYEVKNAGKQGWTKQVRETYQAARKNGKTYTIITRANTRLSSRLKREVLKRGGLLRIIKCLPGIG